METTPFFRLSPPGTKVPSSQSARLPYHDNDACPVGQEVKRSGEWQAYEPTHIADTRVRCRLCIQLSQPHG